MAEQNRNDIGITFLLSNVQSIKSKEYLLRDEIDKTNADFAVITETWLRSNVDNVWIDCCQFNTDGYSIVTANRNNRKGGGLALIHKEGYTVKIIESGQKQSFEYLLCSVVIQNNIVTLAMIYRPPHSEKNPCTSLMFIDDFTQFLPDILTEHKNIVILGDFNLHLEADDPDSRVFTDIVDAMGLTPHVTIPTHKAGHTLDQVYTLLDNQVEVSKCSQGLLLSDHFVIECHASVPTSSIATKTVTSRKLKDIDYTAFMNDINNDAIRLTDIDEAVRTLDAELLRVLDKHAPMKERRVTERKRETWYEDHIKYQRKFVRSRYRVWQKYREQHQWKAYTIERNRLNRMLAGSKMRCISDKVEECGSDTKRLYHLVNNITSRIKVNPMPPGSDQDIADEMAACFLSKIRKIRDDLSDCPTYSPSFRGTEELKVFQPMTEEEVVNIIRSMPTKSCESDVITTKLLKHILSKLGSVITGVVNLSLSSGTFATDWKSAIVRPLLKKKGLELTAKNYRPVSNLPFMSKVVEKCMLRQFTAHCDANRLLPDYQSAYRANFSCETALVELHDNILWSMEKQRVTAIVAIDLSAAFDTVDHNILLDVLHKRFGISQPILSWFESYLRPRSFKVNVGRAYSTTQPNATCCPHIYQHPRIC